MIDILSTQNFAQPSPGPRGGVKISDICDTDRMDSPAMSMITKAAPKADVRSDPK